MKTLLLGWGNPDRQDDGAAWHVLAEIARRFGLTVPEEAGEFFTDHTPDLHLDFDLQLIPEKAELVGEFERVFFIDAHTGAISEDLAIINLEAEFQTSPLTHHLTPQSVLDFARVLYGKTPQAWLISIRGYQFGFAHGLSADTALLVNQACDRLTELINQSDDILG